MALVHLTRHLYSFFPHLELSIAHNCGQGC